LSKRRIDFPNHYGFELNISLGHAAIEFNALAGRGFCLVAFGRLPLWENVLARLATATAAIWA
jgi:hypothetical protein